jgi:hypothetical protein
MDATRIVQAWEEPADSEALTVERGRINGFSGVFMWEEEGAVRKDTNRKILLGM